MQICSTCNGTRINPDSPEDLCPTCKGRGRVLEIVQRCDKCQGKGKNKYKADCYTCSGTGYISRVEALSSDPVRIKVSDIERMLAALIDIQTSDFDVSQLDTGPAEDVRALTVVGALVGYSKARSEEGFPAGWLLGNILEEGGDLVLDASGIWHHPKGSDYGVQIVMFPVEQVEETI